MKVARSVLRGLGVITDFRLPDTVDPISDDIIQSLIPQKIGFQGHWKIDEVQSKFRLEGIPYVLVRHDLKNTEDNELKKWAYTISGKIVRL